MVENKVQTQASFMQHLGKFIFPVCGGGGDKEREMCLHVCMAVEEILSRQYGVYFQKTHLLEDLLRYSNIVV